MNTDDDPHFTDDSRDLTNNCGEEIKHIKNVFQSKNICPSPEFKPLRNKA